MKGAQITTIHKLLGHAILDMTFRFSHLIPRFCERGSTATQ